MYLILRIYNMNFVGVHNSMNIEHEPRHNEYTYKYKWCVSTTKNLFHFNYCFC